jgi:large subunit ribosomal protein L15
MKDGAVVSPKGLVRAGVISLVKGKNPEVKILSTGEITKKLTIINCQVSKLAQEKIEKAGGVVKSK